MRFIDLIAGLIILIVLGSAGMRLFIDTEAMFLKAIHRIEEVNDASIITSSFIDSVKSKLTASEIKKRIAVFKIKKMNIEVKEKIDEKSGRYFVLSFMISGKNCSVFAGGDE
jgi:hypothetical protein